MKNETRSLFASVRTFSRKICRSVGQINSPSTIKVKGPQRKIKAVAAAGMLGVATMFGATGCSSPSDPPKEQPKPPILYYIWDIEPGFSIAFFKEINVTDAQIDTLIDDLKYEYNNNFNSPMKTSFKNNLTEIYVQSGSDISYTGTTLKFGADKTAIQLVSFLIDNGIILLSKNQQKDSIRLANQFDNSKETVRLAVGRSKSEKMI